MFTAGGAAPGHHRGRRRAGPVPFAFSEHPALTVFGVLLVAVSLTMALRAAAIGASARPAEARSGGPVASPGPHAPVVLPGQVPSTGRGSASTSAKSTPSPTAAASDDPVAVVRPTSSPVPVPSQALISYEAEAPEAVRAPGMPIRSLAIASGGRYVGSVGDGRSVRFTNVAAEGGGDYTLTIYYLSAENRTAELRVDDGPPQVLTFAPSGGSDQVAAIQVRIQLLVGLNTVELGNPPGQPSPDLDRVAVQG